MNPGEGIVYLMREYNTVPDADFVIGVTVSYRALKRIKYNLQDRLHAMFMADPHSDEGRRLRADE